MGAARTYDEPMGLYVKLARSAAEHFVLTGDILPVPDPVPVDLQRQRACYVAIIEQPGRRVRSMYGEPLPRRSSLAEEIIYNTVQALSTPLGRAIRRADLPTLTYSVSILGILQRVGDVVHLDPWQYGLYVRSDRDKAALLLPQRAGVETAEDQVATALREAGINGRQEAVTLYRFDVIYDDG